MSNIRSLSARRTEKKRATKQENQRLDEASLWIAKLDRGLSADDKTSLHDWLSLSNKNLTVLLEVAQLWDKMNDLQRLADLFPQNQTAEKASVSSRWSSAIAASIFLIVAVGSFWNFNQRSLPSHDQVVSVNLHRTFSTGIGESNTIELPDGSQLLLNTNTLAEINFTQKSRIIDLKHGEINIQVAHDKSRPLSVIAAGKIIQAVGTAFNVEMRNNSVELIVTEGKVMVAPVDKAVTRGKEIQKLFELPKSSIAVAKGEKIDFNIDTQEQQIIIPDDVIKVAPVEIAASLSWRQGNLIFRGESLEDAMAEISRYSEVEFELDDNPKLKDIRVAGIFRTGDISGLLSVLKQNFNIQYKRTGDNRIVLSFAKSS